MFNIIFYFYKKNMRISIRILLIVLLQYSFTNAFCLDVNISMREQPIFLEKDTSTNTETDEIQLYSNLRFVGGFSSKNTFAIRNNASNLGFLSRTQIVPGVKAVGCLEVGVGLVGTSQQLIFHGDPGIGVGQIDNVFSSHIGYVGFESDYGNITWGKQWSPYYLIAGFTDQFFCFGGEASGAFPDLTDGGISGTGRASSAFNYTLTKSVVQLALQIQHRDITDVELYPNTYAAALLIKDVAGFTIGASYNKVRDGITNPTEFDPNKNDESAVFGVKYQGKRFRLATTYSKSKNHMTDDAGNYFDGWGLELFAAYNINSNWEVHAGGNYLKPDKDMAGDYLLQYLVIGSSYTFNEKINLFVEIKLDDSFNMDGSPGREDIIGFGMFYNISSKKFRF